METTIPTIDPNVKHIGVSKLRGLNAENLKERTNTQTFVIQDNDTPLAVLLSYEKFLIMQQQLTRTLNAAEFLACADEVTATLKGLEEIQAGKVVSLNTVAEEAK